MNTTVSYIKRPWYNELAAWSRKGNLENSENSSMLDYVPKQRNYFLDQTILKIENGVKYLAPNQILCVSITKVPNTADGC